MSPASAAMENQPEPRLEAADELTTVAMMAMGHDLGYRELPLDNGRRGAVYIDLQQLNMSKRSNERGTQEYAIVQSHKKATNKWKDHVFDDVDEADLKIDRMNDGQSHRVRLRQQIKNSSSSNHGTSVQRGGLSHRGSKGDTVGGRGASASHGREYSTYPSDMASGITQNFSTQSYAVVGRMRAFGPDRSTVSARLQASRESQLEAGQNRRSDPPNKRTGSEDILHVGRSFKKVRSQLERHAKRAAKESLPNYDQSLASPDEFLTKISKASITINPNASVAATFAAENQKVSTSRKATAKVLLPHQRSVSKDNTQSSSQEINLGNEAHGASKNAHTSQGVPSTQHLIAKLGGLTNSKYADVLDGKFKLKKTIGVPADADERTSKIYPVWIFKRMNHLGNAERFGFGFAEIVNQKHDTDTSATLQVITNGTILIEEPIFHDFTFTMEGTLLKFEQHARTSTNPRWQMYFKISADAHEFMCALERTVYMAKDRLVVKNIHQEEIYIKYIEEPLISFGELETYQESSILGRFAREMVGLELSKQYTLAELLALRSFAVNVNFSFPEADLVLKDSSMNGNKIRFGSSSSVHSGKAPSQIEKSDFGITQPRKSARKSSNTKEIPAFGGPPKFEVPIEVIAASKTFVTQSLLSSKYASVSEVSTTTCQVPGRDSPSKPLVSEGFTAQTGHASPEFKLILRGDLASSRYTTPPREQLVVGRGNGSSTHSNQLPHQRKVSRTYFSPNSVKATLTILPPDLGKSADTAAPANNVSITVDDRHIKPAIIATFPCFHPTSNSNKESATSNPSQDAFQTPSPTEKVGIPSTGGHLNVDEAKDKVQQDYLRERQIFEVKMAREIIKKIDEDRIGFQKTEEIAPVQTADGKGMTQDASHRRAIENEIFDMHTAELERIEKEKKDLTAQLASDAVQDMEGILTRAHLGKARAMPVPGSYPKESIEVCSSSKEHAQASEIYKFDVSNSAFSRGLRGRRDSLSSIISKDSAVTVRQTIVPETQRCYSETLETLEINHKPRLSNASASSTESFATAADVFSDDGESGLVELDSSQSVPTPRNETATSQEALKNVAAGGLGGLSSSRFAGPSSGHAFPSRPSNLETSQACKVKSPSSKPSYFSPTAENFLPSPIQRKFSPAAPSCSPQPADFGSTTPKYSPYRSMSPMAPMAPMVPQYGTVIIQDVATGMPVEVTGLLKIGSIPVVGTAPATSSPGFGGFVNISARTSTASMTPFSGIGSPASSYFPAQCPEKQQPGSGASNIAPCSQRTDSIPNPSRAPLSPRRLEDPSQVQLEIQRRLNLSKAANGSGT